MFHFDHFLDTIFCFCLFLFLFFLPSCFLYTLCLSFICLSIVFVSFLFFCAIFLYLFFPLVHSFHYFPSPFFLFFSTSLILFRHLFFLYGRFLSISFFSISVFLYLFCFFVSPCCYFPFCSISSFYPSLFCLFSFFCFFISFLCPSLSHFALLPPLSLSILLAFLDLHHLFFVFIAFFLISFFVHLLFLELIFLELILRCFGNPLRILICHFFLHLSFGKKEFDIKNFPKGVFLLYLFTSLLSFFFYIIFRMCHLFLFVFLSSLLFQRFLVFFSAYFYCRSLSLCSLSLLYLLQIVFSSFLSLFFLFFSCSHVLYLPLFF